MKDEGKYGYCAECVNHGHCGQCYRGSWFEAEKEED